MTAYVSLSTEIESLTTDCFIINLDSAVWWDVKPPCKVNTQGTRKSQVNGVNNKTSPVTTPTTVASSESSHDATMQHSNSLTGSECGMDGGANEDDGEVSMARSEEEKESIGSGRKLISPRMQLGPELLEPGEDGVTLNEEARRAVKRMLNISASASASASIPPCIGTNGSQSTDGRYTRRANGTSLTTNRDLPSKYHDYSNSSSHASINSNARSASDNTHGDNLHTSSISPSDETRLLREAEKLKEKRHAEVLAQKNTTHWSTVLTFASAVGATVDVKHMCGNNGPNTHTSIMTFKSRFRSIEVKGFASSPIASEANAAEKLLRILRTLIIH